jgi:hypothetical protein
MGSEQKRNLNRKKSKQNMILFCWKNEIEVDAVDLMEIKLNIA